MTYTYDLTTPTGTIRMTIGDTPNAQGTAYFSDQEIQAVLTAQGNDVGKASVQLLRIWSRRLSSQAKVQIGDYTFDPSAQAKALMTAADSLATELDDELDDPVIGEVGGDFWERF